ncbi:P-loop containing nucleoside triphosphate hydrolase protein [Cantharellus anzutake]|uniref:P-loop containing nucleoside triphosphate hydrolase protein n=1 Tax=Cantharellus anzutake TaxID=1750568 RepID=UPI001903459F|nr:P-loop containing nucleoside triphosphate hydrolase protein [Cantharellus anzutake]KAF8326692.1 P-loop containing nucleoside triphosphate hydrolase protein [Cantharellus anzutake]
MSQPPRLNPGAFSFVPGQVRQPPQGSSQSGPGVRPTDPTFQGHPVAQQPNHPYGQQQHYPNYGQYQPYPQSGYQQQGYPGSGYGGGHSGHNAPHSTQTYIPPQLRQQPNNAQPQPKNQQFYSPSPAENPSVPQRSEILPQQDKVPLERPEPTETPAAPSIIKLNIGGVSGTASNPQPPSSTVTSEKEQNSSRTIKLNIGGSTTPADTSSTATPAAQIATGSVSSKKEQLSDKLAKTSGTTTVVSKPAKSFNFTSEKSQKDADAVLNDTLAVADQDTIKDLYGDQNVVDPNVKQHMNVVFIGHVDAGKSTLGGQLLYLTGTVDKRTMEKHEREAKEAGRETWYLSWVLDSTTQERAKGKTVEVGRAYFETDVRRYTVLDAPGHKTYVPSMISGAAQADIAILVISARKGEFETGFEKGGQTREHIMLVKTVGVSKVVIVVNKMDDPTVEWSQDRFNEIKDKLTPFVKSAGFNPATDVNYIPISAYTAANVKNPAGATAPWIKGPSLLQLLDNLPITDRKINGPVMMPISEKYKDLGTVVVGKLESGKIKKGDTLLLMPNKAEVEVLAIFAESEAEIEHAFGGDNVRVRLRGVEDEDVSPGFVLSSLRKPVHSVRRFEAQLAILDHKNIICAGYSAVMHVHTLAEEVSLSALLHYFDKKTGRKSKKPPQFAKKGQKVIARIETTAPICLEPFTEYPQLGRFTLRDEGKTVAIGKVIRLLEESDITEGVANITLEGPSSTSVNA